MANLMESEQLEDPEFKWIKKRGVGGKNKKVRFYESFTYDGLDYALYDCVYMHKQGEPAPYIGKLVKIWELADGAKKIKVQWFFRPSEISHYLKDAKVLENELFFAAGDGKGVFNVNPLEAIAGKCYVVCTSADSRNPQPSPKELQMADYVFYRVFDVNSCTLSDQIDDKVGGLEVNFVFNREVGTGALDGPKLDAGDENGLNMVAAKETPQNAEITGNISSQQMNNTRLDKNGNAPEEGSKVMQVAVKQGSLDGKHVSGGDVISSKIKEITGSILEEKSTAGAKDVGSNIREKKDKVRDITVPVTQVHVEKGVKHARKSCDLDDAPSKRAKVDGSVSSDLNGVLSVKDSVECRKDLKKSNPIPLDEKLSKTGVSLSKDLSRSGHVEDAVGIKKKPLVNKNPNALQEKTNAILSSEKKKSGSTPRKDSLSAQKDKRLDRSLSSCGDKTSGINVDSGSTTRKGSHSAQKDKKLDRNLSSCGEKTSGINVDSGSISRKDPLSAQKDRKVDRNLSSCGEKTSGINVDSRDVTLKPSTSIVSSKEILKSVPNKELGGSQKVAKPAQSLSLSDWVKRPLEISDEESKKKSKLDHDKSHENKEKNHVGKMKNSPKSLTCDNKAKSKSGERPALEYHNDKDGKPSNDNLLNPVATKSKHDGGKVGGKVIGGKMKNSPKSLTCDNKAKSKLSERPALEYHNDKDGKPSNDNLLNPVATKSKHDGGKVGGKVIEVTPRPLEKSQKTTWIKLSWEQQMKTANDQGRLVLLQNLDPEYTSGEVEDIMWHIFREHCTARMLPQTAISNPYLGQAFAVFKTRDAANKIVHKLDEGCLMLPNQRPLVACHGVLPKLVEKQTTHVGHLVLDNDRRQKTNREWKIAVSTSHYSQHNTIAFEMAMDWCLLQARSDKWWKNLYELQQKELKRQAANLKSK